MMTTFKEVNYLGNCDVTINKFNERANNACCCKLVYVYLLSALIIYFTIYCLILEVSSFSCYVILVFNLNILISMQL